MRLRTFLSLLESVNLENLKPARSQLGFSNLIGLREAVEALEPVEVFAKDIQTVKSSPVFEASGDLVDVSDQASADRLFDACQALYHGATALLNTLKNMMPSGGDSMISVQIPGPVNIKKLISVCAKLEKALADSIVCEKTGGQAVIQHIDPAADWIEVNVGTDAALYLAADLVWSGAVVYGKFQETRVFEKHVKALDIKSESLNDIKKGQNEAIVRLIWTESAYLVEKHLQGDSQQIKRLKSPIKLMADLIRDGVHILPSEHAAKNVKELFPNFENLESIRSRAPESGSAPKQALPAGKPKPAAKEPPKPASKETEPAPAPKPALNKMKPAQAPEPAKEPQPAPKETKPASAPNPAKETKKAPAPKPVAEPREATAPKKDSLDDTVNMEV